MLLVDDDIEVDDKEEEIKEEKIGRIELEGIELSINYVVAGHHRKP